MWSAFIFHGQVQSTICPCEILGEPPQGQLHSSGITGAGSTPSRRGSAAFTVFIDYNCLNLLENQRLVSKDIAFMHDRIQPKSAPSITGYSLYSIPLHKSAHSCLHVTWMAHFHVFTVSKWASHASHLLLSVKWSESCSDVSNSATPWTMQSMEFSRPEYWSG